MRNLCNVFARSLRQGTYSICIVTGDLAVAALLTFLSGVFILPAKAKISCFISLSCFKIKFNGYALFVLSFIVISANGDIVSVFSDESKFLLLV